MERIKPLPWNRPLLKAALFDFDGTLSTLRFGWEDVMEPMMLEYIAGETLVDDALIDRVRRYIDQSTGVQTYYQMEWLANEVKASGRNPGASGDPWWYKDEYNRRLMELVVRRRESILSGKQAAEDYLMEGTVGLLQALKDRGIKLYVASGTDHEDVNEEARILGLAGYFEEIAGAPSRKAECSKEMVIRKLISDRKLEGREVAVFGDGKVEIRLGSEAGAITIGVASDEEARHGINAVKRERLIPAGADAITGDFRELPEILDYLKLIRTYPVKERHNLVTIDNMRRPGADEVEPWEDPAFDELVERILTARKNRRPVILSMGAHVIKNRLSAYLIEMMKQGWITHIAGNGAGSIHDFELCFNGGTSEDVPSAIEDGSFGMWEETGLWMNEALREGAARGLGYGESLAAYIDKYPGRFPHKGDCVLYQAYKLGIPATYHIAIGTDIIHQHPAADFGAIGACSGADFHTFCHSVARLDGGVFLNFGSGVIGPEVFLKALSIARNLGYDVFKITTANFDLVNLGDYRCKIGYDDPNYYYRPRKNIVNRPTSRGGKGWHFCVDHQVSIPNLYRKLLKHNEYAND